MQVCKELYILGVLRVKERCLEVFPENERLMRSFNEPMVY